MASAYLRDDRTLVDEKGHPLPDLRLGATWREDGNGLWIEGTQSDHGGRCRIFLPMNERLYLRGQDGSGRRKMPKPVALTPQSEDTVDLGELVVPLREGLA